MQALDVVRRALVGCVLLIGLAIIAGPAVVNEPPSEGDVIRSETAHGLVRANRITLVDIRQPEEWSATGVAEGAILVTMHQPIDEFIAQLSRHGIAPDSERPVALICARGVRSRWLQHQLIERGYRNVLDVTDGMLGSPGGDGWLASRLPVRPAP